MAGMENILGWSWCTILFLAYGQSSTNHRIMDQDGGCHQMEPSVEEIRAVPPHLAQSAWSLMLYQKFIADEMYLSSNHNNLLCHDGGPNREAVSSMRIKIEYEAEHGWVTYSDSKGKEEFDCKRSALNCTVAMMPPMKAKKARLYMWCPHYSHGAFRKQMQDSEKLPVVGFADPTGTKVNLKVQFKCAAHHGLKAEAEPVLSGCTLPENASAMTSIGAWTANTVNYRPGGEVLPQSILQATQHFSLSLQGYMFVQDHGSYTLYVKSHGACKVSELCVILEWHQM